MIDEKKIYYMLELRMFYNKQGLEQPNYKKFSNTYNRKTRI